MAEAVVLSSDRGDADDRLVTASGVRIRDNQLVASEGTLDWSVTPPSALRRLIMTQDASNAYSVSTSADSLLVTAAAAGGNQREAFLFPDSLATDSEIDSLIGTPDAISAGEAQMGNLHAIRYDTSDGLWHGVACWTDTTIPLPTLLNFGVITFTGAGTMSINNLGNNPIGMAIDALRYAKAITAVRASDVVTLTFNTPRLPPAASTGSFVTNTDATFHVTGATVTGVDRTNRTLTYAQVAGAATDATAGGIWQPATKWATAPFRLRSRLVGNVLSAMVYFPEEGRPDWADTARVHSFTLSGGPPAFVAGEGACGLWTAHVTSGNVIRFGQSSWKRLS